MHLPWDSKEPRDTKHSAKHRPIQLFCRRGPIGNDLAMIPNRHPSQATEHCSGLPVRLLTLILCAIGTPGIAPKPAGSNRTVLPPTCLTSAWSAAQRKSLGSDNKYWAQAALANPLFSVRDPHMNPKAHTSAIQRGRLDDALTNSIVMQQSGWDSHSLATWCATILLREKLGYRAVMVEYTDTVNTLERMGSDESTATSGTRLPAVHADVEFWPNGKEPQVKRWRDLEKVDSAGPIGYLGKTGWYVLDHEANGTNWVDYWRLLASDAAIQKLSLGKGFVQSFLNGWNQKHGTTATFACVSDAKRAKNGAIAAGCNFNDGTYKTPECVANLARGKGCVTLIAASPSWDSGLLQQAAKGLHLPVEVAWLGGMAQIESVVRARKQSGKSVLFYNFKPNRFLVELATQITRVALPEHTSSCIFHNATPDGGAPCDFPGVMLMKYQSSRLSTIAPYAHRFVNFFHLTEADMASLLQGLLIKNANVSAKQRHWSAACSWIRSNPTVWADWIDPRVALRASKAPVNISMTRDSIFVRGGTETGTCPQACPAQTSSGYISAAIYAVSCEVNFQYTLNVQEGRSADSLCQDLRSGQRAGLQATVVALDHRVLRQHDHACNAAGLSRIPIKRQGLALMVLADLPQTSGLGMLSGVLFSPVVINLFCIFALVMTVAAHLLWCAERKRNQEQFPVEYLDGIDDACWWGMVTATTVGYGDKAPITMPGRCIALAWMILGLVMFAFVTGTVTSTVTSDMDREHIHSINSINNENTNVGVYSNVFDLAVEKLVVHGIGYNSLKKCTSSNGELDSPVAGQSCEDMLDARQVDVIVGPLPSLVNQVALRAGTSKQKLRVMGEPFKESEAPGYYFVFRNRDRGAMRWLTQATESFAGGVTVMDVERSYFGVKNRQDMAAITVNPSPLNPHLLIVVIFGTVVYTVAMAHKEWQEIKSFLEEKRTNLERKLTHSGDDESFEADVPMENPIHESGEDSESCEARVQVTRTE